MKRFAAIFQLFKDSNEHMDDEYTSNILFDEMIEVALWGYGDRGDHAQSAFR